MDRRLDLADRALELVHPAREPLESVERVARCAGVSCADDAVERAAQGGQPRGGEAVEGGELGRERLRARRTDGRASQLLTSRWKR